MTSRYPLVPEVILITNESKTMLGVGQSQSMVYPISRCCYSRAKVDNGLSPTGSGKVAYHWYCDWYCDGCGAYLKNFNKESLGVNDFETGPEGPSMIRRAIASWTLIPLEDIQVEVSM